MGVTVWVGGGRRGGCHRVGGRGWEGWVSPCGWEGVGGVGVTVWVGVGVGGACAGTQTHQPIHTCRA